MKIVLFYSGVESFNYFTNCITDELTRRGHECFILDLNNMQTGEHSIARLTEFMGNGIDMAVSFDGLGIKEDIFIELWDSMNTRTVNILMDHPLRFHPTMSKHPRNYIQYCCDRNHVEYVKKYFADDVSEVKFMPHAGTYMGELDLEDYGKRPYEILFSGTYYKPSSYIEQIREMFPQNVTLQDFYVKLSEYMIANNEITTEAAVVKVVKDTGLFGDDSTLKTLLACSEPIDWMARMYYREQVIGKIAKAGLPIYLIGRGWENHPCADMDNFHILTDRVPFGDTFAYMKKAKINLNIMPWFKDGTHDRVFNSLLMGSLCVTDPSKWLSENLTQGKEIVYYDLKDLDKLPSVIEYYLDNEDEAINIIRNGFDKVKNNYTWVNCVDQILHGA